MILEKIKLLHKEFGDIDINRAKALGFSPRIELDVLKRFLKKGKWSSLSFSTQSELAQGLKIIPDISVDVWPSYILYQGGGGEFYACDMLSTILFKHIYRLNTDREQCKLHLKNWVAIRETLFPVYKLFGGTDDLKDITELVFDKTKWPAEDYDEADTLNRYRLFCLKRDPSYGNQYLWNLLDNLTGSKDFMPELPTGDLGIYEARILKLISSRVQHLHGNNLSKEVITIFFDGFRQPHGYDTCGHEPDYYPNNGVWEDELVCKSAEKLTRAENVNAHYIMSQPEYSAAKALSTKGIDIFTGREFLEAAAILDEEYNEPKRAWNCLVSAGYWAGKNLPGAQETIVKAAIYLCEKHNWLEAAEVLKYNLDIMQSA